MNQKLLNIQNNDFYTGHLVCESMGDGFGGVRPEELVLFDLWGSLAVHHRVESFKPCCDLLKFRRKKQNLPGFDHSCALKVSFLRIEG